MATGGAAVAGNRTVAQYRRIDLFIWAVLLTIAEMLIVTAATKWFPGQPYTLSAVGAITAIVMMRWGWRAVIHAALGGVVFCLASGAGPQHYAVYAIGNLAGLGALGLIKAWGEGEIRLDPLKAMAFGLATVLLMQTGRALISLAFGAGIADFIRFYTTDIISLLFTAVVVWIARKQDGVFEEQGNYLLRISREEEEERESDHEG